MRYVLAALAALLVLPVPASAAAKSVFYTREAVVAWIDNYRHKPEPSRLPAAIEMLSKAGALARPGQCGLPCRLHRRRARRQSQDRGKAGCQNAAAAGSRSVGCGARHRLFRTAGMENAAAQRRAAIARAASDGRLVHRGHAADARQRSSSTRIRRSWKKCRCTSAVKVPTPEISFGKNPGAARRAVGPVFSRPAITSRSGASSRCCPGRRTATASTVSRSAARRSTRSPTTRRMYPDLLALLKR